MGNDGHSFEALFRHAPVPMYLWERLGGELDPVLTDFNDAAMQLTDSKIPSIRGKRVSELYAAEPQLIQNFRRCLDEQRPVFRRMKYQLRSSTGAGSFRVAFIPVSPTALVVAVVLE